MHHQIRLALLPKSLRNKSGFTLTHDVISYGQIVGVCPMDYQPRNFIQISPQLSQLSGRKKEQNNKSSMSQNNFSFWNYDQPE